LIELTAATRLLVLLGDPVAHSLSPSFQNAALRSARLDAAYLALRCGRSELGGLMRGIALAGGAGNVTIPHKEAAAEALERPSDAVRKTGACNTFWSRGGRLHGENTDVVGFARAVEALLGGAPAGARVLLLGAGGSARAVVLALLQGGAERISILNRRLTRADELRARFSEASGRLSVRTSPADLRGERFDLVVNSTPCGLHPDDPLPIPPEAEIRYGAALDLVYARGSTRWVREQQAHGIPAADGREMLLHQGAAAFECWWGFPPPLQAMRDALYRDDLP
jgi:shikimate dehydrogenase